MAEDALLKKSADIAVPLEQLGYETGRGIEDEHREVAARHARPREMEPGGIARPTRTRRPRWPSCPANWKTSSAT